MSKSSTLRQIILFSLPLLHLATAQAELFSEFDTDTDNWRSTDGTVILSHQAVNGASGGYLHGQAAGDAWAFVSPESWAGDWTGYQVIRFQLAIPSGHYPDEDTGSIVVIQGANGETMTWNGPTPLKSWTRYEISLSPTAFGVSQTDFNAIMADVLELRIAGEYVSTVNETVGLDEVEITVNPIAVFTTNLVERFGNAVVEGTRVNGWSPVDDCTLYTDSVGYPLHSLKAVDWQDGRNFKVASPASWSGDWSAFTELRFNMRWTSTSSDVSNAGFELVTIYGGNGGKLTLSRSISRNNWIEIVVPLTAEEFGVDQATFDAVISHVSQIWIRGEFNSGRDDLWLDNIVVSIGPPAPTTFPDGLSAYFDSDAEGWFGYDNSVIGWSPAGFFGGAATLTDTGTGLAKFSSPDGWAGDWSNFQTLRFMLLPELNLVEPNVNPIVAIHGLNNVVISTTPGRPMRTWTPYTLDLTPATFGVSQEVFDSVMSNVSQLTIVGDLVNGLDTTLLDELILDPEGSPEPNPVELLSTFDSDNDGWRKGGRDSSTINPTWGFLNDPVLHSAIEGNPPGSITINDEYNIAYWFSPESWAGDWRGYREISFDLKIVTGTNLLAAGDMLRIFSPHGTLTQNITTAERPIPGEWVNYTFHLSAQSFGVSEAVFQRIMRDVFMIGIRAEWISGAETEALDNVSVTKGDPDYWIWAESYFSPEELALAGLSGRLADYDGDGLSNFAEFMFLTAPNDATSRPVTHFESFPDGSLSLNFPTHSGRRYWIEQSTDLGLNDPWSRVGDEVPGNDDFQTLQAPPNGPANFLRLGVSR